MKSIEIKDNKNNIIKKHNDLVNRARYSLSEDGIKLVSMLIAMIHKDDETFQEYHIKVSEFSKLKGSSSKNDYDSVHKIIKELLSCPIQIGNLQANFIASGEYKEGTATAVFEISQKLKPYLLELKKDFLEYNINDILSLKSSYVIRLYELMAQEWNQYIHYNKNAKSFTFDLDVDEMRNLFEIPKSQLYGDIKRHIIEKAKEQFKEKTNIIFDYKEYKIGKSVKKLIITVESNNKGSNDIFASRKAFINFIRKEYSPDASKNHFPIVISTKSGDIKVNLNGEIYLSGEDVTTYNNKQADKLWDWLYDLVKNNPSLLKSIK